MLVNLPDGWAINDFGSPYADLFRSGELQMPEQLGVGMYLNLYQPSIQHLVVDEHPFDPLFSKGTQEERFAAIRQHYDEDSPEDYGVCDQPMQVIQRWPQIATDERPFILAFDKVRRADQPAEGGWRWHKWGRYIGNREPKHEYLYDEPEIDSVYLFQIYQLKEK
jgi:hypothetical protein